MPGCVLVPLDGSPLANRALAYASALARARSSGLLLVRVLMPKPRRGEELVQEPQARAELERIADRLRTSGLSTSVEVSTTLFGSPAEVIVATAERAGAGIIVMSTHGRSGLGRWLYGSVADNVIRRAPMPVLLVPAIAKRAWPTHRLPRILLALDGSDVAARAIEPTCDLAQALGAEVTLVHVLTDSSADAAAYVYEDRPAERREAAQVLESASARLRQAGIPVVTRSLIGDAGQCIADLAREHAVDVIAMATHGRSGMSRAVLGSVATETLQRAAVPMLLVRAPTPALATTIDRIPDSDTAPAGPMRILVPLDLTDKACAVLPEVSRIARACDAEVILLNVFTPIVELGRVVTDSREAGLEYLTAERRMYLERKAKELLGVRVSVQVQGLRHGEGVAEGIARVAAECNATMVMLAATRLPSMAGLVLGSVAQGIVARSPCPVTIVRYEPAPASPTRAGDRQRANVETG